MDDDDGSAGKKTQMKMQMQTKWAEGWGTMTIEVPVKMENQTKQAEGWRR